MQKALPVILRGGPFFLISTFRQTSAKRELATVEIRANSFFTKF